MLKRNALVGVVAVAMTVVTGFGITKPTVALAWPVEKHRGVDACGNYSAAQMQNLWSNSSYAAYGFYIGGAVANAQCSAATTHPTSWVSAVVAQGWNLEPIYSDRQPPCNIGNIGTSYPIPTSSNTDAYNAGVTAGNDAIAKAYGRGISGPIFLDIDEDVDDGQWCAPFVDWYTIGWMQAVASNSSYIPGLYSGVRNLRRAALWGAPYTPAQIVVAQWNNLPGVYQVNSSILPNYNWTLDQRGHQYVAGANYVIGGITYSLDIDCFDEKLFGTHTHSVNSDCLN